MRANGSGARFSQLDFARARSTHARDSITPPLR
jgi:hypothetical protein